MKIYFTAAISAVDQLGENYRAIVDTLEKMGHTVISDHILKKDIKAVLSEDPKEHEKYYRWMEQQLSKADLLVAEVSFPSTVHVGHELTLALEKEKPVLALYTKDRKPVLLWGITSEKFFVEEYDLSNIKEVLQDSVSYLTDQMDVRFNFFVSPKIVNYLNWISKKKKLPRAVYLRNLIEKDMDKNKEYLKAE